MNNMNLRLDDKQPSMKASSKSNKSPKSGMDSMKSSKKSAMMNFLAKKKK
jgi:hypothetical protein